MLSSLLGYIPGVTTGSKKAKKDEDTYYTQNIVWYIAVPRFRIGQKNK